MLPYTATLASAAETHAGATRRTSCCATYRASCASRGAACPACSTLSTGQRPCSCAGGHHCWGHGQAQPAGGASATACGVAARGACSDASSCPACAQQRQQRHQQQLQQRVLACGEACVQATCRRCSAAATDVSTGQGRNAIQRACRRQGRSGFYASTSQPPAPAAGAGARQGVAAAAARHAGRPCGGAVCLPAARAAAAAAL